MPDKKVEIINDEYTGGKRSTCEEAASLLNEGKIFKAWFRPGMSISSPENPGKDLALIWEK